jgi:peptide deformylase
VSVTPIRIMGDPVLRTPAAPVVEFDKELQQLVADLTDTMHAAGGAGLAAPQIGVGLRVFTWYVDGEVGHIVNPDVVPVGEDVERDAEGCLSIPGYRFDCDRYLTVAATGWDMHGEPLRVEGSHKLARAIQHETEARAAALDVLQAAEWQGHPSWLPEGSPLPAPVVKVSPH